MEYFFSCPYCGEEVSFLLELSEPQQKYVEDCEVCCNPIEVTFSCEGETILNFEAKTLD